MSAVLLDGRRLRWLYLEPYGSEVLCVDGEAKPVVFPSVYQAVAASRRLGGCALDRCRHAPMRWVLVRGDDSRS